MGLLGRIFQAMGAVSTEALKVCLEYKQQTATKPTATTNIKEFSVFGTQRGLYMSNHTGHVDTGKELGF